MGTGSTSTSRRSARSGRERGALPASTFDVKLRGRLLRLAVLGAWALVVVTCSASAPTAGQPAPAPAAREGGGQAVEGVPQVASDRKLVYTANVVLRARDPWAVAEDTRAIAAALGGDVLNLQQTGEGDRRSARVTLRVPADRFEDALARVRALEAEVASSSVDTKDVTEQFVDLSARLSSKQREEQQYLSLLSQARSVDDTLKVSQALAAARTEIERLTGQLNLLRGRIDYSTISLTIDNIADFTTQSAWQPLRTVALAFAALVALLKAFGDLVIWVLIVGWVPAVLVLAFRFLRDRYDRRFGRRPVPAQPPPGA